MEKARRSKKVKQPGDNPQANERIKVLGGESSEMTRWNFRERQPDDPERIHIEQMLDKLKPIKKPIATIGQQQMQMKVR